MKYLDFEKHIKNELNGSKEVVQMDALLASLNLGQESPKKRRFPLWMILPFLLVASSFVVWNFMDSFSTKKSDLFLTQEISTTQSLDNGAILANDENLEKGNGEQNAITQSKEESNSQAEKLNNSTINNAKLETNTSNSHINNPHNSINNSRDLLNHQPSINVSNVDYKSSIAASNVSKFSNSYLYQTETNKNDEISNKFSENHTSAEVELKNSRGVILISEVENSLEILENLNTDANLFSRMKINCPSFDNSGWHMALIPEVGIFHPIKTLENKSPEESLAFNERIKSETTLEGIEIGLYGMLVRDKIPFYLKGGVSYSRISERMDLKYEYTEQDTTIGIISSTVSANGDTITHIYGDIITETTYKGSNRQHHYLHLFDIPISVGYTTYFAGLDIGVEAGVKVNFMTRATGNLLTAQNEYTNLSLNKMFKNRIGLSYFGGLMIGRNFGKLGDIYIAPRFTYYPDSFNNASNTISQKYFNIGINAGIVYKI
jgi:hypothetical protein